MVTIRFEDGADEALDGHFAGSALCRVVDAHRDFEWLEAIDVWLDGDVPTVDCVFRLSSEGRGGVVVVSLGEGYVHLVHADRDGEVRSAVFRSEAAADDHGSGYIRGISRPWSEDAFLRLLREALDMWTRVGRKGVKVRP